MRVRGYIKWLVAVGIFLALLLLDYFQRGELEKLSRQNLTLASEKVTLSVERSLTEPASIVRRLLGIVETFGMVGQKEYESPGISVAENYSFVVQSGIITQDNQVLAEYPHHPSTLNGETVAKILHSGGKTFVGGEGKVPVYVSDLTETADDKILLYSARMGEEKEFGYLYLAVSVADLIPHPPALREDEGYWMAIYDSSKQEVLSHRMDQAQDLGISAELFSGGENPWTLKVGYVSGSNRGWVVGRFVNFTFGILVAIIIWVLIFLLDRRANTLASAVKKRTKSLENVNKEMEEFVYVVSHDLKAPLITIQGMIDIFMDSPQGKRLSKRSREFMETIKAASERMGDLIGDLLQLSRVGRFDVETERVNIAEVVEVVFSEVRTLDVKYRFNFSMEGNFPALRVNRRRIYQIFANLINNAVKFMSEDNTEPYVLVTCEDKGEFYEFRVKDNGAGIDPRYQKRIFGVFKRLHGRQVEGTGIGLAFVKKIVETQGGIIWVDSDVGRGAEFIFTLPKED